MTGPGAETAELVSVPLDEVKGWVEELAGIREQQRKLKEAEDRCRQIILADLESANATIGTIDGQPVVQIRTSIRETLDTKRLRKDLGDVALAPYLTSSATTSLVFPGVKK